MDEERLKEIEARVEAATPGRLLVSDNEDGWAVDPCEGEWDENEQGPLDGALIYGWHREDLEAVESAARKLDLAIWVRRWERDWVDSPEYAELKGALDKAKEQDQEPVPDTDEGDLPITHSDQEPPP